MSTALFNQLIHWKTSVVKLLQNLTTWNFSFLKLRLRLLRVFCAAPQMRLHPTCKCCSSFVWWTRGCRRTTSWCCCSAKSDRLLLPLASLTGFVTFPCHCAAFVSVVVVAAAAAVAVVVAVAAVAVVVVAAAVASFYQSCHCHFWMISRTSWLFLNCFEQNFFFYLWTLRSWTLIVESSFTLSQALSKYSMNTKALWFL